MNNKELIQKIIEHQNNPYVHPLTCGNNSNHGLLYPYETYKGNVHMICPDCDYTQTHIPTSLFIVRSN